MHFPPFHSTEAEPFREGCLFRVNRLACLARRLVSKAIARSLTLSLTHSLTHSLYKRQFSCDTTL